MADEIFQPNQFKPSPYYEKRNKQIYDDYLSGMSGIEMVKKYNISHQRIHQIVTRERKKLIQL